jgi:positive regulator of sigma E activity
LEDLYTTLDNPEQTILLYLDIREPPQSLVLHHGARKTITSLNVLEPFYKICNSRNIPLSFAVRFNELYKLGFVDGHPVIRSARNQGINALYISGSRIGSDAETEDTAAVGTPPIAGEDLAGLLVDYAHSLRLSMENLDYHFLIFPILDTYIFISEPITVIILFLIIGAGLLIILVYSGVYRRILIIQWKMFSRHVWIFALFLGVPFVTLWLAGVLVAQTAQAFGIFPLIKTMGMAVFKIIIALLLFSGVFILPSQLNIPRKANLYGNTAVILVTLGVLIGALQDITFIPLFIWIFLFTFLGAILNIPFLVYLCAFTTPLLAFGPLFNIVSANTSGLPGGLFFFLKKLKSMVFSTGRLTDIILSQNMVSFLYIIVITLPFILLFERARALSQKRKAPPPLFRQVLPPLILLIISLGALVYYTYALSQIPQRDSGKRIGDPDILHVQYQSITFLERRNLIIAIEARGTPLCFNLSLITEDESLPVIYAAPMPFRAANDLKSVEFILGEGPPNPFNTEIVLPLDFSGFLRVEAIYTSWDPALDPLPPPEGDAYFLEVSKTIPLLE